MTNLFDNKNVNISIIEEIFNKFKSWAKYMQSQAMVCQDFVCFVIIYPGTRSYNIVIINNDE